MRRGEGHLVDICHAVVATAAHKRRRHKDSLVSAAASVSIKFRHPRETLFPCRCLGRGRKGEQRRRRRRYEDNYEGGAGERHPVGRACVGGSHDLAWGQNVSVLVWEMVCRGEVTSCRWGTGERGGRGVAA